MTKAPAYQREIDPVLGAPDAAPTETAPSRHTLWQSFRFAAEGFFYVLATQRNFRLQLCAGAVAVGLGGILRISRMEWAFLTLTIAAVLVLEMLNTAVESMVDLVTRDYHPLAKIAKDIAAGAVLVASATAVAIGGIIFVPHVWAWWQAKP